MRDTIDNVAASSDTIVFNPSLSGAIITLTTGELLINKDLTMTGPTGGITVDGNNSGRVFDIQTGVQATIFNVTIRNGSAAGGGLGGGILNNGALTLGNSIVNNNAATGGGGGIANNGTLTLNNSTVGNNTVPSTGGGISNNGTTTLSNSTVSSNTAPIGGGMFNSGTMTLSNSTVSNNTASGGGGIYNTGTTTLNNSTFSSNTATNIGGGIYNGGTLTLSNCTVSSNSSVTGGGIHVAAGSAILKNTILAKGTGNNCTDPQNLITSQGHNLDSDGTCGFAGIGDFSGIDPRLAPLANNGGPTQTHALCTGPGAPHPSCGAVASPAIDAVPYPADCTDTAGNPIAIDQRGVVRPQPVGGNCDIGAYEEAVMCSPLPDGSGCTSACPNPNGACGPQSVQISNTDPPYLIVTKCACGDPGSCGPITINPVGANDYALDCLGTCPSSANCEIFVNDMSHGQVSLIASHLIPGDVVTCRCSVLVPTVSDWGLATLTVLGIVAGILCFSRRKTTRA
ncbi:MAG: hypothetical protein HY287_18405 [Planctomycetes bacterium]|nr:hypothetical protein [Planctomycetota bacterium]